MSDAKITPLARRLAEENGIDWRQLPGTGPDGTVVERDILAFLAKVMAGEVSLPPAPEDTAVPTDAVANMAQAQAALQKEGVQLGDLLPSSSGFNPPAPVLEDDLDFDIDLDLDSALVSTSELEAFSEAAPTLEPSPHPTVTLADEPSLLFAEEQPAPAPAFSWDSPLEATPQADVGLPPLPSGVELLPPSMAESPNLVWETTEVLPPPSPREAAPIQSSMNFSQAPVSLPEVDMPSAPQPVPAMDDLGVFDAEPIALNDLEPEPEPLMAEPVAIEPEPMPTISEPVLTAPEPAPVPPVVPTVAAVAAVSALAPEVPAAPAVPQAPVAPTVNMLKVQAWQRLVNLEAAHQAAQALSEGWNLQVGLYPILFRAVDKALADTQTSMRAAKGHLEGDELQSLRVAPSQSLRGVLDSLQMSADAGEGLAVLSLVDGDFDHVVFPGRSTLILGRAPSSHALLSLSSDLDAAHASKLLERVAYYLERPILLV